ncbi:MAG TPA: hypothetical protein VL426_06735 [Candidatus Binatia bacterium]|nr:hypothetical protein [Candidatus Binatia bacterium]
MKTSLKQMDVKKMTRLATAGVVTLALAILVSTAWFIARSLGRVAVAKSGTTQTAKVQGVNTTLLDKDQKAIADKQAAAQRLAPNLGNPFIGTSTPPPTPPPPAPEPTPAPAPTPPPAPAPAPTPTPTPAQ